MVIRVITNNSDFANLERVWTTLHRKINGTIFQSYFWNYQWWKIYQKDNTELLIITVWNNNEIVGILPLFKEKIKIGPLKFTRSRFLCVYQAYGEYEPLVDPEYKSIVLSKIILELQQYLKEGVLDWVSFYGFPYNSESMFQFIEYFKGHKYIVIHKPKIVTRVVKQLPNSWEEYINSLSINEKTMLQRRIKSLNKNNVELEILKDQEIKSEDFKDFVRLHTAAWESKGFPGFFKASENFEKFLMTIVTTNNDETIKKLYFFKKDHRRFVAVLSFFSYPICYFYLSGMEQNHQLSRYSPGKVLLSYVIKDAIDGNYKIFDFQGGKETYKYQLGGKSDYYSKVDIFSFSFKTPFLIAMHYLLQFRQVLLTFLNYNKLSKLIRRLATKFKIW